jgi:hypothetical protein
MIALLIVTATVLGLASTAMFEFIIDFLCQEPLASIRSRVYPGRGYELVGHEEVRDELIERNLLSKV